MKKYKIFSAFAGLLLTTLAVSCDSEKDLIIYDGNLPIKSNTLYMVGDATPVGWNIDAPEPMTRSEEDGMVFIWEGTLYAGELKLCLVPGSWDNPFIRPVEAGTPISKTDIVDAEFIMHAGDPDNKWVVIDEGRYKLSFNLRNWTMSTTYLGEGDAPVIEPIEADAVYLVGDGTPVGWNIDDPLKIVKTGAYTFEYDGELYVGEMKACLESGEWNVSFIRPASNNVTIGKDGVSSSDFVFTASPDNKWNITDAGIYHLTFDLENWKISAEYVGEIVVDTNPIEAETVYIIGDATPVGWNIADPFELTKKSQYIFEYQGALTGGNTFKCCLEKGPDHWDQSFIRPSRDNVKLTRTGLEANDFVFTMSPDDKWLVEDSGEYRLVFDLEHRTVEATFIKEIADEPVTPPVEPGTSPLETATLYLIGSATPGGWDMGQLTEMTRDASNAYVFTWTGNLTEGEMKACVAPDGSFSCPFVRPTSADVAISKSGVAAPDCVYTTDPDDKWVVTEAGTYCITIDLEHWTIKAEALE